MGGQGGDGGEMTDETTEPVEILTDEDFGGFPLGPKMAALNRRHQKFAFAIASGKARTKAEAVRMAGFSQNRGTNDATAYNLLHRPDVTDAIRELTATRFANQLTQAVDAVEYILAHRKHPHHAKVALSVLSRLGFGEQAQVAVNVTGEVVVNHVEAALEDLQRLKAMGVSREMLLKSFGHTGLDRYERMLREREVKVIEHLPEGKS